MQMLPRGQLPAGREARRQEQVPRRDLAPLRREGALLAAPAPRVDRDLPRRLAVLLEERLPPVAVGPLLRLAAIPEEHLPPVALLAARRQAATLAAQSPPESRQPLQQLAHLAARWRLALPLALVFLGLRHTRVPTSRRPLRVAVA